MSLPQSPIWLAKRITREANGQPVVLSRWLFLLKEMREEDDKLRDDSIQN